MREIGERYEINAPWNVSEEGVFDARLDVLALGAKYNGKFQRKSRFRFKSTPMEAAVPVEDAGLRFLRQHLH